LKQYRTQFAAYTGEQVLEHAKNEYKNKKVNDITYVLLCRLSCEKGNIKGCHAACGKLGKMIAKELTMNTVAGILGLFRQQ
jgi:hypothetical protein